MGPINRRILVVEDESSLRTLFRRRAERAGLHVLDAVSRAQGIALAALERPDLILLDLHLPDGSGLVLLQQLKADPRTSHIPVVAWSGSDAQESETAVLRAGAAAYFKKTDLKALVNRIVELTQRA
jgi:two-component system, cell cycle response regulator DivK